MTAHSRRSADSGAVKLILASPRILLLCGTIQYSVHVTARCGRWITALHGLRDAAPYFETNRITLTMADNESSAPRMKTQTMGTPTVAVSP